jgi:eukaryotic-like serine/threonine-protein kinase
VQPGTRLAHYEIIAAIGRGGMGEVWQARDTKLQRDVAIKTLPPEFAGNTDRLARFEREARLLASLNHPNIAAIYGLEEFEGARFLVLELVPGETLADRLSRGPIPVAEAVRLALQITEALEAAHERGVVHRDLKPANVKVTPEGKIKVLDFGLAKALSATTAETDLSNSPTLTLHATGRDVILGTAGYMSPEQARGTEAERTADIWAFGVILLEMLTGVEAFAGPTLSDSLARVLEREPPFEALPPETPANIRRLLRRCLEKDPARRLQHIGDARLELTEPEPNAGPGAGPGGRSRTPTILAGAVVLLAVVALILIWRPVPDPTPQVMRLIIPSATGEPISSRAPIALSPDGTKLVYGVGGSLFDPGRLYLHDFSAFEADEAVTPTLKTRIPFFSPDGNSLGFGTSSAGLRQVSVDGGTPRALVDVLNSQSGSWGEGVIVSDVDWGQPLYITDVGRPDSSRPLTQLDSEAGELAHVYPDVLPDNSGVLFTVWSAGESWDEAGIAVADLERGNHTVVERGTFARYAATGPETGYLMFWREGALMARPFDPKRLKVTGVARRVLEDVRLDGILGTAHFALSQTGTLAYVAGGVDYMLETWLIDRASGSLLRRIDTDEPVGRPRFSPQGDRILLTRFRGGTFQIALWNLERNVLQVLTSEGDNVAPSWFPGGERILFASNRDDGRYPNYTMSADGSRQERVSGKQAPGCCSRSLIWPDGTLVYSKVTPDGGDLWRLTPGSESAPEPLIEDPGAQDWPEACLEGRFIAYQSSLSDGSDAVFLRPYPGVDTPRTQVSATGGRLPVCIARELFYIAQDGIRRVLLDPETGMPTPGSDSRVLAMRGIEAFDVSPDGSTIAVTRVPVESAATDIRVITNFFEILKEVH